MEATNGRPGIVVLYNHSQNVIKGDPKDLLADQGVIACAHSLAEALTEAGDRVALTPITSDVETALQPYPATEWVVFNLGEGLDGRLFEETRIAWAIETMGYRFTGSDAAALGLSTHKARAKEALARAGVATPAWRLLRHPDEVTPECLADFPLPLIVKPVAEDASQGIPGGAVVRTPDELRARVDYLVHSYRQAALVEEFIEGREFNISVWGNPPTTLPIAEIDFSAFQDPLDRIVSFAAKWEEDSFEYTHTPVTCPAQVSPQLARDIRHSALKAWKAIGCEGYARVDMRVSKDNVPYVIEVNCNPDLSADAGFFRAARTAGNSYRDMAVKILQLALRQKQTYDRNRAAERRQLHPADHAAGESLQPGRSRVRRGTLERISAAG